MEEFYRSDEWVGAISTVKGGMVIALQGKDSEQLDRVIQDLEAIVNSLDCLRESRDALRHADDTAKWLIRN